MAAGKAADEDEAGGPSVPGSEKEPGTKQGEADGGVAAGFGRAHLHGCGLAGCNRAQPPLAV